MALTKNEERRLQLTNLKRAGWVLSEEERRELAALEKEISGKPAKGKEK